MDRFRGLLRKSINILLIAAYKIVRSSKYSFIHQGNWRGSSVSSSYPLIPNAIATKEGLVPIATGPVRFAVGPPDGLTSNSWRLWVGKKGDIYLKCRDNFREAKVSLHVSGRWRFAYTSEAIERDGSLIVPGENRAWDVWDEPPPTLPSTIAAFKLLFPISELAVQPAQRRRKEWRDVIHIEPASSPKMTVVTLFITDEQIELKHESEPSFCLASLPIGNGRRAQLVAHVDAEGNLIEVLEHHITVMRQQCEAAGQAIPTSAYSYLLGQLPDSCRFLVGARVNRL